MKFFQEEVLQARKARHLVCGDYFLCDRTPEATVMILCDGIGSGVYANVAAITCGDRLKALLEGSFSLRAACEQVAESMHRARSEETPFAAFVAARILPGGQYTVYAYENPGPIHIHQGIARALKERYIAVKYEMIAEYSGVLEEGDMLMLCSDGVTHAGLGGGFATGWEIGGVVEEINAFFHQDGVPERLLSRILHTSYNISGKVYWDDTSLVLIHCRRAAELTVLTGPPINRAEDANVIRLFMEAPGQKVICGSSTTEIASRELKRPAEIVSMNLLPGHPPEYKMEGVDLICEGAVTLNQTMNLLLEDIDFTIFDTPVFRLCRMLLEADSVSFIVGCGYNPAHEDPLFRQLGVKPRQRIISRIADHLKDRGKLVSVRKF